MKCLDCEEYFTAEDKEKMMTAMHPHYMESHKDIMANVDEEKKKAWFIEFDKKWEKGEDV